MMDIAITSKKRQFLLLPQNSLQSKDSLHILIVWMRSAGRYRCNPKHGFRSDGHHGPDRKTGHRLEIAGSKHGTLTSCLALEFLLSRRVCKPDL